MKLSGRMFKALLGMGLAFLALFVPIEAVSAQQLAFVADEGSDVVAVVDVDTRLIVEEIDVGRRPKSLAATPDGEFVYVVVGGDKLISVIDVATLSVVDTIDASGPQSIAITPDGLFAYVSARFAGVEVFRLSDNTLFDTVTSGFFDTSQEVAITPDGSHVYVANVAHQGHPSFSFENVTVIETATNTVVAGIDVSALVNNFGPWGITALPDGKKVYSNDGDAGRFVFEIDSDPSSATFNEVTAVIDLGVSSDGPRGMESGETPVGVRVYASVAESDEVVVIDPATNLIVSRVFTGHRPFRSRLTPDGSELWVAIRGDGEVLILDTASNTEIESITGFSDPRDIAFIGGPTVIVVDIDIKPGSDPNGLNPRKKGVVPVAILTTDGFDAWDVDSSSLAFGPEGAGIAHALGHAEDVDGDGDLDMVVHFPTQDTGIACGDTEATLTGETLGGQAIEGTDSVKTSGCK